MAAKKAQRRKTVRKEAHINLRLTDEQKGELTIAATHEGLSVSSWLVATGLREARRIAREADGSGKK
jgi:uncharacterized protein (DUF1778 family)